MDGRYKMTTKEKLIEQLKAKHPILKVGSDENETEVIGKEYDAIISEWADNFLIVLQLQTETVAKTTAKTALLNKLGITAEEAALLLS